MPQGLSIFSNMIKLDSGFIGLLPLFISSIIMLPGIFSSRFNLSSHGLLGGISSLMLMLNFDQSGFLFDLLEEDDKDSKTGNLDVIGNMFKMIFKLYITRMTFSESLEIKNYLNLNYIPETLSIQSILSLGYLAFMVYNFYSLLGEIDFNKDWEDLINYKSYLIITASIALGGGYDRLIMETLIIQGAIADNVKKILQLNIISTDEKIIDRAIYQDIQGDFLKDVLFPCVVFKTLVLIPHHLAFISICSIKGFLFYIFQGLT